LDVSNAIEIDGVNYTHAQSTYAIDAQN